MKKTILMFLMILFIGSNHLKAQDDKNTAVNNENKNNDANRVDMDPKSKMNIADHKMVPGVTGWPEASKMAVEEITGKYGKPDGVTDNELIWLNKGNWKKICITKHETKHSFPIEHTDMLQQTISYKVPEDKMDDLGKFDGSVTFDRTQGTLSARCDMEGNNLLALNLAHDIITGKRTADQARTHFAAVVKQKMNGGNPEYMQKLMFSPMPGAEDPDKNTTGLTKEEVMKGIKKNGSK